MTKKLNVDSTLEVTTTHDLQFHTDHFWTSVNTDKINFALLQFHKLNLKVEKNGSASINASVKRKYVKLDDIMNIVRPALATYDCYIDQHLAGDSVITRVVHVSGQFIASKLHYQTWEANQVNNLQRLGGGLSYLKRYSISAILNIVADEDTDGEGNDNIGYKKPTEVTATSTALKPNVDADKEWLNLTNKNGSPNAKGEQAKKFIREGGKLKQITDKYKLNKGDYATLAELEKQVTKEGIIETEVNNSAIGNKFKEEEIREIENEHYDMFGDEIPY